MALFSAQIAGQCAGSFTAPAARALSKRAPQCTPSSRAYDLRAASGANSSRQQQWRPLNAAAAPLWSTSLRRSSSSSGVGGPVPVRCSSSVSQATSSAPTSSMHTLPDGMCLELLTLKAADGSSSKPPLLFVHGSYHAAWCWAQRFMPYFSAAGHDCHAVSLRAQGGSDRGDLKVAGDFESHARDLAHVIAHAIPSAAGGNVGGGGGGGGGGPPVVVAHSFGAVVAMQLLSQEDRPDLAGVALLCGAPPSGNKELVGRIFKAMPIVAIKVTWGFITKSFARSKTAAREMFFSTDLPEEDLDRYQVLLAGCSPVPLIDVRRASNLFPVPPPAPGRGLPPAFVAGASADVVVDVPAVRETHRFLGLPGEPVIVQGMAHDCMLDTKWEEMAAALNKWLQTL